MATFETLPLFEEGRQALTRDQQALFRKVALEAFAPDLMEQDQSFRPALRVREMLGSPGVFEMSWGEAGRATFSHSPERLRGQPHVIWRQIVVVPPRTNPPDA